MTPTRADTTHLPRTMLLRVRDTPQGSGPNWTEYSVHRRSLLWSAFRVLVIRSLRFVHNLQRRSRFNDDPVQPGRLIGCRIALILEDPHRAWHTVEPQGLVVEQHQLVPIRNGWTAPVVVVTVVPQWSPAKALASPRA